MQTVELFCGTKSFSRVAAALGHATFTVDNDARHAPDAHVNILALVPSALPFRPLVLWASPPCEAFSVAAINHNWNPDGTPRSERAVVAMRVIDKTLALIHATTPRWWLIENPRGMLRTLPAMQRLGRHTIAYCQYGDTRQKPTDIWTNAAWWQPRPMCSPRSGCHVPAPRGSRTGTQGIVGAVDRARIPAALFHEIFTQMPQTIEVVS